MEIIKEEKDYIVINKPAGLMVHSDGKSDEKTLSDLMLERYPEIKEVGEPIVLSNGTAVERPGIVHRLDKDTTGVMLVARTDEGFEYLKQLFKDREIKKTYHAFLHGNIREDEGTIDEPIGRSKKDFRRRFAGEKARGQLRDAVTDYKVIARAVRKDATFIEAYPKTGRTHQIRVHFNHIYHPLVADNLYAPNRTSVLGFDRLALHSRSIEFVDLSGETVVYEADYPEDFHKAIEEIILE